MRNTPSVKSSAQLLGDASRWVSSTSTSSSSKRRQHHLVLLSSVLAPKCGYVSCQFIWSAAAVQCSFFAPVEYCAEHISRMIGRIEGWSSAAAAGNRSSARQHAASAKAEKILRGDFFGDEQDLAAMKSAAAKVKQQRVLSASSASPRSLSVTGSPEARLHATKSGFLARVRIVSNTRRAMITSSRDGVSTTTVADSAASATLSARTFHDASRFHTSSSNNNHNHQVSSSSSISAMMVMQPRLADPRRNLFRPTSSTVLQGVSFCPSSVVASAFSSSSTSSLSGNGYSGSGGGGATVTLSPAVVSAITARTSQLREVLGNRQQPPQQQQTAAGAGAAAAVDWRTQWEGALRTWIADTGRLASMLRSHDGSLTAHRLSLIERNRAESLLHPRDYDAAVAVRHAWMASVFCGLWREALAVGAPPLLVASALSCAGPRQTRAAVSAYVLSFVSKRNAGNSGAGGQHDSSRFSDVEEYVTSSSLGCYLASEAARASCSSARRNGAAAGRSSSAAGASWQDAVRIVTQLNYRGYVVRSDFHLKLSRLVAAADGGGNWAAATQVLQQVCFESEATFQAWSTLRKLMEQQQQKQKQPGGVLVVGTKNEEVTVSAMTPALKLKSIGLSDPVHRGLESKQQREEIGGETRFTHSSSSSSPSSISGMTVRQAVAAAARLLREGRNRDAMRTLEKQGPAAKSRLVKALDARKSLSSQ